VRKGDKVLIKFCGRLWGIWRNLSKRVGRFQSRIFLLLFYFSILAPFALAVKIFADSLNIKHCWLESYWLPKMEAKVDLEQFRRQF